MTTVLDLLLSSLWEAWTETLKRTPTANNMEVLHVSGTATKSRGVMECGRKKSK